MRVITKLSVKTMLTVMTLSAMMMLTRVKDDDGTHSQIVRFSSTRARQLFFEKKIYGSLFWVSSSHLLVIYEDEIHHRNVSSLYQYSSVMKQYHINIQNIEYIMII